MGTVPGLSPVLAAAAVAVLLLTSPGIQAGKILAFPMEGSHWVNMNIMIQDLHARGHEVTVVRTDTSWYVREDAPHYRSITVSLPEAMVLQQQDFFVSFLAKMLQLQRAPSLLGFLTLQWEMLSLLSRIHEQASAMVVEMFENETLMQSLRDAQFDVVLLDPALLGGVLVAHELQLPTVFNVNWICSGDGHYMMSPSPMSYVPTSGNAASDKMTFLQRVMNLLQFTFNTFADELLVYPHYDKLVHKYFSPDVSVYHLLRAADIWLMRVDFVFEFPRPTMPNVVYIGGFQCRPPGALSSELEAFVQSSGEHGFIVMSLGTIIKGLPVETSSEIAAAFAQIPQKVIWRHAGERPDNVGNNTLLVDWLPQNDLLGHPKAKAFVAHCGTNGVYEAIYHGVPVLGVPLLFDQFENCLRLDERGAAKVIDVATLTRQSFREAIHAVIHEPSYRNSMRRLSALHRDAPMHPMETALYWIEFVMRHKGASHLRTESYRMPWYAYHSVDVLCFLTAVVLLLAAAVAASVRFLCCRLCRRRKPKQD
ncbi:uncharacterized protein V6R79_016890 [Siganus canaliculatus]